MGLGRSHRDGGGTSMVRPRRAFGRCLFFWSCFLGTSYSSTPSTETAERNIPSTTRQPFIGARSRRRRLAGATHGAVLSGSPTANRTPEDEAKPHPRERAAAWQVPVPPATSRESITRRRIRYGAQGGSFTHGAEQRGPQPSSLSLHPVVLFHRVFPWSMGPQTRAGLSPSHIPSSKH